LKAMERSKQHELMSIRNGPQLTALREEYQAATMTANEIDLEKKRAELKGYVRLILDQNADIQQKMEDLQENNRRIAKVNRELNYQITLLEDRNATLQSTLDHLQSKVDQLKAKKKVQEEEMARTIRQTQTEKKVGRVCHLTILRIREQTKVAAAKSDDAFLKKVHRRAQILERIKKRGAEEACPVILSG
jgi:predicted nuclease with TOPRIM domain